MEGRRGQRGRSSREALQARLKVWVLSSVGKKLKYSRQGLGDQRLGSQRPAWLSCGSKRERVEKEQERGRPGCRRERRVRRARRASSVCPCST